MVNVLQCIWQEGVWGNKGKTLWANNPSACRSASQSASNGLIKENSNLWERHPPRWEPGPHWAVLIKDGGFLFRFMTQNKLWFPKSFVRIEFLNDIEKTVTALMLESLLIIVITAGIDVRHLYSVDFGRTPQNLLLLVYTSSTHRYCDC